MTKAQSPIILFIVAALSWSVLLVSAQVNLVPPLGFSAGLTGKTVRGTQKYVCKSGTWVKTGSHAEVYAPDGSKLGKYWSNIDPNTRAVTHYWNIANTHGTAIETGNPSCTLQAAQLKSYQKTWTAISEFLAIVKQRTGAGDSDMVTFVTLTGTKGGVPPKAALCTTTGTTSAVPFFGNFTFYTQDRQPPQNIPTSIAPKGTYVHAVFVDGRMKYKFAAGKWHYEGFYATILDVAGGTVLGRVGNVAQPVPANGSNLLWKFYDPNGYWLSGRQCAPPVQMSPDGCPWRLMLITTSGGAQTPFGAFKYALMAGTLGGEMPKIAARSEGMEWGSCFRGLFYMYAE